MQLNFFFSERKTQSDFLFLTLFGCVERVLRWDPLYLRREPCVWQDSSVGIDAIHGEAEGHLLDGVAQVEQAAWEKGKQ